MTTTMTIRGKTMPPWTRFFKTPKGQVFMVLVPLTLVAALFHSGALEIWHVIVAEATALSVDAVVAVGQHRKARLSTSGMITGLIVADILSSMTPWYLVGVITTVALTSKHILKRGRKPIFNPAALGLLTAIWGFSAGESWWASLSLLPIWCLPALLGPGVFLALRVKKYPQVLAFLGTYFFLLLTMAVLHLGLSSSTPTDALRAPFVNSAVFFSLFMLTDPPTSPSSTRAQVQFGILAAVTATTLFATEGGLSYLLVGLLTANLWTAGAAWWHRTRLHSKNPKKGRAAQAFSA